MTKPVPANSLDLALEHVRKGGRLVLRLFREDNPAFDAEKFLSACKPRR